MSASSSDLNSRFDSLEQRMASFRARSKASSAASSTLNSTRNAGEEKEVVSALQSTDHYDAFVTSISAANVVPSSRVRNGSVASPTGRGSRATSPGPRSGTVSPSGAVSPGRRGGSGVVNLSNISRHDDGWTSNGEESTDLASQAAAKRRQMADPSASPPLSAGLVMAYKSDGEGSSNNGAMSSRRAASISGGVNSGELSARRPSKADQGTEHLTSWAEAQALAKAKEQALVSARRRREEAREAEMATREAEARENLRREREEATKQREREQAEARERQAQAAKDSSYLQSPLTARSRAAQEAQQSGYIVHANDSKEVLGALASFEKKRQADEHNKRATLDGPAKSLKPSASGKLTNRGSSGGEMTNRDRRARTIDPNALDQDDASIYNNSTFVPSSARGTGSNTSRSQTGTARGARPAEVKDRRQEVLDRKEKARQRKELALAAITLASTPVEQGGTLVIDPNNPNYANVQAALTSRKSKEGSSTSRRGSMTARSRQRMREKAEGSSSSSGTSNGHHHHHHHHQDTSAEGSAEGQPSTTDSQETNGTSTDGSHHPRPHEERKCEMLDFKGVGEKQCVIQ